MYNEGDLVRIKGTFTDAAGTKVDPATVLVYCRAPDGTTETLTHGVDAEVVREAAGVYYVDVNVDQPGTWHYSFRSTGTGQAAKEKYFRVAPSSFF